MEDHVLRGQARLLTQPGTPQFEKETHRSIMNQSDVPNSRPTVLKSRVRADKNVLIKDDTHTSIKNTAKLERDPFAICQEYREIREHGSNPTDMKM